MVEVKPILSLASVLLLVAAALAACEDSGPAPSLLPPPTLPRNVEQDARAIAANQTAQAEYWNYLQLQKTAEASKERVTEAALDAQKAAAQITASANATREALAGQATRQALSEQATERAQNAAATATGQAVQATQTAIVQVATQSAQSVAVAQTVEAAQFAATDRARSASATETAFAQVIAATATSRAQDAGATATLQTQSAQATQVAARATATIMAAQVLTAQEKADWDRKLEAGRALGLFLAAGLAMISLLVLIGWAALRLLDALVLRLRVIRDKTGVPFVILEPDRAGRQTLLAPSRSPGAVTTLTLPDTPPARIEALAVDADTTRRDQAIALTIAATGEGHRREGLPAGATCERLRYTVQVVDVPPRHLVPPEAETAIDAEWRTINE